DGGRDRHGGSKRRPLDEARDLGNHAVGMNVDGSHAAAADRHLAAFRRALAADASRLELPCGAACAGDTKAEPTEETSTVHRAAVALVTLVALASSWFNWGFSLIFSAVLAREVARRVKGVDYRALAAASFLGVGSIWAQGLSGSAALQMATPGALQPQIRDIVSQGGLVAGGIIPFRHTIFLWQSLVSVIVEIIVVTTVMWLATPPPHRARTARAMGIEL